MSAPDPTAVVAAAAPESSAPERPQLTLLGAPDAVACEGDACALPPRP